MKKSELKELMNKHGIIECELNDVCNFVSELLHRKAREIEQMEPYATKTIAELDKAAYEAFVLIDDIEAIMEGEDE